jgi:hexokinase
MGFRWSFLLSAASDILISFLPTQQIQDVPLKSRKLVRIISDIITKRAARLAAAGIVAVLQKIGRDGTLCDTYKVRKIREGEPKRSAVAIEGGLYQGYSVFREYLNEALVEILGDEIAPTVTLLVMEDGSRYASSDGGWVWDGGQHSLQRHTHRLNNSLPRLA